MKMLVESVSGGMLCDGATGCTVSPTRPSVVANSPLIQERLGLRDIKVLYPVTAEATDEEFAGFWDDSHKPTSKGEKIDADKARASAIDNFKSKFGADPEKKTAAPAKPAETTETGGDADKGANKGGQGAGK